MTSVSERDHVLATPVGTHARSSYAGEQVEAVPVELSKRLNEGILPRTLGFISDIHGNAEGLKWALNKMGETDLVFCAGDAVFQYSFSNEVFDLLRKNEVVAVRGNHEAVILSPDGERLRGSGAITAENMDYMERMPVKLEMEIGGRKLLMVHGSPWKPLREYVFPQSTRFNDFNTIDADIIVLGHTHYPMVKRVGEKLIVNPGSCGDARENDDYGKAWSYAVLDLETGEVELQFHRLTS